jgi:hypothetical protein
MAVTNPGTGYPASRSSAAPGPDAIMTWLYTINGRASLGGWQCTFRLLDENGAELTGELQGLASERFDPR